MLNFFSIYSHLLIWLGLSALSPRLWADGGEATEPIRMIIAERESISGTGVVCASLSEGTYFISANPAATSFYKIKRKSRSCQGDGVSTTQFKTYSLKDVHKFEKNDLRIVIPGNPYCSAKNINAASEENKRIEPGELGIVLSLDNNSSFPKDYCLVKESYLKDNSTEIANVDGLSKDDICKLNKGAVFKNKTELKYITELKAEQGYQNKQLYPMVQWSSASSEAESSSHSKDLNGGSGRRLASYRVQVGQPICDVSLNNEGFKLEQNWVISNRGLDGSPSPSHKIYVHGSFCQFDRLGFEGLRAEEYNKTEPCWKISYLSKRQDFLSCVSDINYPDQTKLIPLNQEAANRLIEIKDKVNDDYRVECLNLPSRLNKSQAGPRGKEKAGDQ